MSALRLVLANWYSDRIYPDHEITDVDNLDPIIRHWLYRKGFTSAEHILELRNATGRLSDSLIILLGIMRGHSRKMGDFRNPDRRKGDHTSTGAVTWNADRVQTIAELLSRCTLQGLEAVPSEELTDANDLLPNIADIEESVRAHVDTASDPSLDLVHSGVFEDPSVLAFLEVRNSTSRFQSSELDPRMQYLSLDGKPCIIHQAGGSDTRPACHAHNLGISVPGNVSDFATVNIAARLSPKGVSHPDKYFTDDLKLESNDPATRLALEARFVATGGTTIQSTWCKSTKNSWKTLFRCNSFVEYLEGVPNEQIMLKPRRYSEYRHSKAPTRHVYTSPVE